MFLITVVMIVTRLPAADPAPYVVQPDFAQAIEALPVAPLEPTDPGSGLRQRRREEEAILLDGIRSHILTSLNLPCTPRAPPYHAISSADRRALVQLVNSMQSWGDGRGQSDRLKRAQSFYPSCDHPAEQDPSLSPLLERQMPSLDVYFNLTSFFPTVPKDVTIEKATLRVFKVAGPRSTSAGGRVSTVHVSLRAYTAPANTSERPEATSWSPSLAPGTGDVTPWSGDVTPWSGGWTPPEVNSDALRLVDELTVSNAHHGWLTFDVRPAVQWWQEGDDNLGFLLAVEDEAGQRLQPERLFQDMECGVDVPSSPVPGLLVQVAQQEDLDVQSVQRYPVLDLLTSEPAAAAPLPIGAISAADAPCPYPDSTATPPRRGAQQPRRHRLRHGRQRRTFRRQSRRRRQR